MKTLLWGMNLVLGMTELENEQCKKELSRHLSFEELVQEKYKYGSISATELECSKETCCTKYQFSRMTSHLSETIFDKFNQQAESIDFAIVNIKNFYHFHVKKTRDEFETIFSAAYPPKLYKEHRSFVDNFLDSIENFFEEDDHPKEIFDQFFKDLIVRNYAVFAGVNTDSLTSVQSDCLSEAVADVYDDFLIDDQKFWNSDKVIKSTKDIRGLFAEALAPLKRFFLMMKELSNFFKILDEEKLMPSARCIAPTIYCGACTNQLSQQNLLVDRNECESIQNNMCFEWFDNWTEIVKLMNLEMKTDKKIDGYRSNLPKVFEGLAESMSLSTGQLISYNGKINVAEKINSECGFQTGSFTEISDDDIVSEKKSTETRKKFVRSIPKTQFGSQLSQILNKSNQLRRTIGQSICGALPIRQNSGNSTYESAKGLPQQSITYSDKLSNDDLETRLSLILKRSRQRREVDSQNLKKKMKKSMLTDDEDINEGSGQDNYEASGAAYDDPVTDLTPIIQETKEVRVRPGIQDLTSVIRATVSSVPVTKNETNSISTYKINVLTKVILPSSQPSLSESTKKSVVVEIPVETPSPTDSGDNSRKIETAGFFDSSSVKLIKSSILLISTILTVNFL